MRAANRGMERNAMRYIDLRVKREAKKMAKLKSPTSIVCGLAALFVAMCVLAHTARALSVPARTWDKKFDDGSIIISICPAIRS